VAGGAEAFHTIVEMAERSVLDWLLDSDPAIRWQVMRDLLDAARSTWSAERAKVESQGWGAQLLSYEDPDGQWAGGAFLPSDFPADEWQQVGQPWTATCFSLTQLREFGLDPASRSARRAVALIGVNSRWDHAGERFWDGEVEECINGRTVADGAYFGVDVSPIVERLVNEQQDEGGWNCERANGSVRASFATTINVLEGLLEYERATGGTIESRSARRSAEEYLLERKLFRHLSNGEPADAEFLALLYPNRWHYDVLRALDYFRGAAGLAAPDPRLTEAVDLVRSKQLRDGRWLLDTQLPGRTYFQMDAGPGTPSRWITLRALRVLKWADRQA
jgi:hypothetical protein